MTGLPDRYEDLGPIGQGSMAEVRRVRDRLFDRVLAMKIVHPHLCGSPAALARFVEEARATAQLQHPNILPVYDVGTLPDGRSWFTMKEVRGRTLDQHIAEELAGDGLALRRGVAAVLAASRAVAYAHDRGVVHRDLKPANLMIGAHGEVYVLDWGLMKVLGGANTDLGEAPVLSGPDALATRVGQIAGTPAYMAPEQARGERVGPACDVYALGATLFHVLTGRPPYTGPAREVLRRVLAGPPALPPGVPDELAAACTRALQRDPAARHPDARALAEDLEAWLEGTRKREQALKIVDQAFEVERAAAGARSRAEGHREEAASMLDGVAAWEPESRKAAAWALQAEAEAEDRSAQRAELEVDELLRASLQIDPGLPEAHAALVARARVRHARAEAERDSRGATEAVLTIERHANALPDAHPERGRAMRWLGGEGALTLVTDPPGARVELFRYVPHHMRLTEVFQGVLGPTPLVAVPVPMGSYVCVIRHPDRADVRYPVEIPRQGHWDGVPPGHAAPRAIRLPLKGELPADACMVPAGWFTAGGDLSTLPSLRLWCEGFAIDRTPVTNAAFLTFLDALAAEGRIGEALAAAPRERAARDGALGALLFGYDGRSFALPVDLEGDRWRPDWPVVNVSWAGARAYLAWRSERTGLRWRLPGEFEWEKAARGVDARLYPWGDGCDPSWCRIAQSARGRGHGDHGPAEVFAHPVDQSPYGVLGLGGNVMDWCLDAWDQPMPVQVVPTPQPATSDLVNTRGGTWDTGPRNARASHRARFDRQHRVALLGFRGVCELGAG